ncbi:MAG: hypothetical protein IKZ12_07020 [Alistipes sp.]|nr:hypothetical protein [Alistipes sp.]
MRHFVQHTLPAIFCLLLLTACQELPRYFVGEKPIARVGERELTVDALRSTMPAGLSAEDSVAHARRYVDLWIRKQLKLQEAEQLFSASAADIDRMVEEYRQALFIRKLDQYCVDRMADTTFSEEELSAYYTEHLNEFRLDRTIVKGMVVRVPKSYRQTRRLRELMISKKEAQQQDFRDLCLKHDFELNDFSESWVDYTDLLSLLPIVRSRSYDELLTKKGIQEMSDASHYYYFTIDAVRKKGDTEPIERLKATIRRVLFNQRQQQVIRDHEEALYQQAAEVEGFRIFAEEQPTTGE